MKKSRIIDTIFYNSLPEKYIDEFDAETSKLVLDRGKAAAIMILVLEVALMLLHLVTKSRLFQSIYFYYMLMYILMIFVMISFLIIYHRRCKYDVDNPKGNKILIIGYSGFVLYWSAGLSVLDQILYGQIVVYIIAIISIAVFTYIKPSTLLIMFFSCQIAYMIVVPFVQTSDELLYGNLVNSTMFILISWVISRMQYKNRMDDYVNKKVIEAKNEELFNTNQRLNETNEKLHEVNEKLEMLSITDSLTGLYNRRKFDEALAKEWGRRKRYKEEISVLFIDIDCFKAYNDNYGHQAGDQCIRSIADVIRNLTRRAADISARYGGEEFVVVLPRTSSEFAFRIAEKIRMGVESKGIVHEFSTASKYLSVSIGVYTKIPTDDILIETFIEKADKALYMAKQNNRNQVYVYEDTETETATATTSVIIESIAVTQSKAKTDKEEELETP